MLHIRFSRSGGPMPVVRALAILCCLLAVGCTSLLSRFSPAPVSPARNEVGIWISGLEGLTSEEQGRRAAQIWQNTASSPELCERAMILLCARHNPQSTEAQQSLARLWNGSDQGRRASLERTLMADLLTADNAALRQLVNVPSDRERLFPWNFTVWQAAQRGLLADNAGALRRLSDPSLYALPALLGLSADTPARPVSGKVALLLPLSGQASRIGKQIADGAKAAVSELARQGVNMDVIFIDTDQPDWLTQVTALPADCVTVGGPLLANAYQALREHGLSSKAQFAFLPTLPHPEDEGISVWRFFTSPADQIEAVLDFATDELGIVSYGILAPQDAFGNRMTDLFLQAAAQRGLTATAQTYPVDEFKAWNKLIGTFVDTVSAGRNRVPRARAGFEAIFLPDSWKNMDMLISTLHYHGAGRMVMLGTSLWEQGLAGASGLTPSTFALSVFPGAWNPQADNAAAVTLRQSLGSGSQNRDWPALGFDFVRFAAALGLQSASDANAPTLNRRLSSGFDMDWAGAPISWDGQGRASRSLFLFQPSPSGKIPLDREAFRAYREGRAPLPNVPPPPIEDTEEDEISALIRSITGDNPDSAQYAPFN